LTEIAELYDELYLYDVDKELLDEMLTMAYIYSCGDQYSYYYTAEQWQKQQDEAAGKSAGVGVYVTTTESDEIQIIKIMQNSPASRAGLQENDVIVSVDGKKVKDIGYDAASAMIGGEVGTEVVLEILRAGEIITVTVIRDYYDSQSVFYEMLEGDGKRLGYVKITEFMSIQTTGYQFKNAVEFLTKNGAEGLIFDLRDNGGGDLYAILYILDYLLPEGPLVHIHYAGEKNPTTYYSGANEIDIPMTVLTNGQTASAAELLQLRFAITTKRRSSARKPMERAVANRVNSFLTAVSFSSQTTCIIPLIPKITTVSVFIPITK
ncbi:MAG: PDZ domain-containing protein, partial [Clostridia bacterium]|nr:PDZ domain-containing protein [Clostridia bacterium]